MRESLKRNAVLIGVALGGAMGGYWFAPQKIKIEERIVEKKVVQTVKDQDKNVVRVREKRPDGTVVTRTEVNTKTTERSKTDESREQEKTKTVQRGASMNLSLLAGKRLDDLSQPPVYGVAVSRAVLGPISLGLWGLTDKTVGVSLGVQL